MDILLRFSNSTKKAEKTFKRDITLEGEPHRIENDETVPKMRFVFIKHQRLTIRMIVNEIDMSKICCSSHFEGLVVVRKNCPGIYFLN